MRARTDRWRLLAPLLLLAAGTARAGEVRLSGSAPRLGLCTGEALELRIESAGPPSLGASVGVLSAPRPAGPGNWVADYRPPEECHPQVAILVATAGGSWGWLAVPLVGQGDALVQTSPRAVISVRIGEREFGPATADAWGRALVSVVVAPGVRTVWHGKREIPLQLPPVRRVHLALDRAALPADEGLEVVVRAFAVQDDGSPADGAALAITASEGALSAPRVLEPGVVEARWRLAPGRAGVATVSGALPGDAGGPGQADLARPAGPPATAALTVQPAALAAGAAGEVRVQARVRDAQGNPVPGPVRLEASFGEVVSFAEAGPGEWAGLVRVPPELGGRHHVQLSATAGAARGQATVSLRPGPPEQLRISLPQPTLVADGRGVAEVLLRTTDRFGNPADEPPSLVADLGRIEAPVPVGDGSWKARYRVPRLEEASWDGLSARLGDARGLERLRLLARPRALEVAARFGVTAHAGGAAATAGLEVAFWPAALRGQAGLALEAGWWRYSRTDQAGAAGQPLRLAGEADMAPVTLSALLRLRVGERGAAWAGAGGGLVVVRGQLDQGGLSGATETGVAPEAHALVAAGWRLGPGRPFAEARVAWQGDAGISSLRGSLLTWTLSLGYRLETL